MNRWKPMKAKDVRFVFSCACGFAVSTTPAVAKCKKCKKLPVYSGTELRKTACVIKRHRRKE